MPTVPHRLARRQLRLRHPTEEGTAAGIYGVIVGSAVMATSHAHSAVATAAAVLVTLGVYWGAERYSRLVAERIHEARPPSWAEVRRQLATGWEIVTASAVPLAVLLTLDVLRVDQFTAVIVALVCSTVLLFLAGWEIGRLGHLHPLERVASAAVAGSFGLVMVVLKAALH